MKETRATLFSWIPSVPTHRKSPKDRKIEEKVTGERKASRQPPEQRNMPCVALAVPPDETTPPSKIYTVSFVGQRPLIFCPRPSIMPNACCTHTQINNNIAKCCFHISLFLSCTALELNLPSYTHQGTLQHPQVFNNAA